LEAKNNIARWDKEDLECAIFSAFGQHCFQPSDDSPIFSDELKHLREVVMYVLCGHTSAAGEQLLLTTGRSKRTQTSQRNTQLMQDLDYDMLEVDDPVCWCRVENAEDPRQIGCGLEADCHFYEWYHPHCVYKDHFQDDYTLEQAREYVEELEKNWQCTWYCSSSCKTAACADVVNVRDKLDVAGAAPDSSSSISEDDEIDDDADASAAAEMFQVDANTQSGNKRKRKKATTREGDAESVGETCLCLTTAAASKVWQCTTCLMTFHTACIKACYFCEHHDPEDRVWRLTMPFVATSLV